jgi:hypothetical protein
MAVIISFGGQHEDAPQSDRLRCMEITEEGTNIPEVPQLI